MLLYNSLSDKTWFVYIGLVSIIFGHSVLSFAENNIWYYKISSNNIILDNSRERILLLASEVW